VGYPLKPNEVLPPAQNLTRHCQIIGASADANSLVVNCKSNYRKIDHSRQAARIVPVPDETDEESPDYTDEELEKFFVQAALATTDRMLVTVSRAGLSKQQSEALTEAGYLELRTYNNHKRRFIAKKFYNKAKKLKAAHAP
jgi:hypothetical protein